MGTNYGACGAFGLLLSDYKEELGDLLTQMEEDYGNIHDIAYGFDEGGEIHAIIKQYPELVGGGDDAINEVVWQRWMGKIIPRLRDKLQIVIPEGAELWRSVGEENSPGRQETPDDSWILGFGVYVKPRDWPAMDDTFYREAKFHTWVWAG